MRIVVNVACYALILYASTMVGFTISRNYSERPRQLQNLLTGVQMLLTEIVYAATPLSTALWHISRALESPIANFFSKTAQGIEEHMSSKRAWDDAMDALNHQSALLAPDLDVMKYLGDVLGTSDREDQQRHLLVAARRLEGLYQTAQEEARRNETMWKYLGILCGVVVVIIIL